MNHTENLLREAFEKVLTEPAPDRVASYMADVLSLLAVQWQDNADHVEHAWQEGAAGRPWRDMATYADRAAAVFNRKAGQ